MLTVNLIKKIEKDTDFYFDKIEYNKVEEVLSARFENSLYIAFIDYKNNNSCMTSIFDIYGNLITESNCKNSKEIITTLKSIDCI